MVQGNLVSPEYWELADHPSFQDEEWDYLSTRYDEEMYYLDQHVSELYTFLEKNGYLDNFIMVLVSDHGEHFGEHDLALHANSVYEPLVHIPLILVASHNVTPGEVDEYVSLLDIPTTLLDYAEILIPENFRGKNLLKASQKTSEHYPVAELGDMQTIYAAPYKAIFDSSKVSLYNLELDPGETYDCAEDFPEVVEEMLALKEEWMESQSTVKGIVKGVELDRALKEQLRALGYVK
jgi:arylsulfatase A-like enzyme